MNITQILVKGIFLIQLLYLVSPIDIEKSISATDTFQEKMIFKEAVLGVWKYTMSNVDSPYEKGVLFISKNDTTFDVTITYPTGVLTGQDVIVHNGRINFNMNIAGLERVSFVLMAEGDRIMGESYSNNGSNQILGVRQLPGR